VPRAGVGVEAGGRAGGEVGRLGCAEVGEGAGVPAYEGFSTLKPFRTPGRGTATGLVGRGADDWIWVNRFIESLHLRRGTRLAA